MRVLLLSAYHAKSHQYWCDGLVAQFPEHAWTVLSLPARYFSWRVRGNGLTWSIQEAERLQCSYDLVLATSMTDLATLRGLVPALAVPKNIVYFHENQFAYPQSSAQHKSVEPQLASIFSALAADAIYFNSEYNRATFFTGAATLLRRLPDCVPAGVTEMLRSKSEVLAVPIHCAKKPASAAIITNASRRSELQVLHVVWNHRWEYDKGGDLLLKAIGLLPEGCAIKFFILGQSFRQVPKVFAQIKALLVQRQWLGHWGYIEDLAHYQKVLSSAHVVLSTSLHDFQGLAVLQAVNAGCIPLVPDRLAYKELFAKEYRYGGGEQCEAQTLALELARHAKRLQHSGGMLAPDVSHLCWHNLRSVYQAKFHL